MCATMAEFCELMKLLLSVPVVGAAPERAEVIARKLRMAEIEEDDIRYLDADDVKQITGVTAERVRLRRLMENMEVAQQQRWDRLPKPRQLREREEFLIERPTEADRRMIERRRDAAVSGSPVQSLRITDKLQVEFSFGSVSHVTGEIVLEGEDCWGGKVCSLPFQTRLRYREGRFPGEGSLVTRVIDVKDITLLTPAGSNGDPYAGTTVAHVTLHGSFASGSSSPRRRHEVEHVHGGAKRRKTKGTHAVLPTLE